MIAWMVGWLAVLSGPLRRLVRRLRSPWASIEVQGKMAWGTPMGSTGYEYRERSAPDDNGDILQPFHPVQIVWPGGFIAGTAGAGKSALDWPSLVALQRVARKPEPLPLFWQQADAIEHAIDRATGAVGPLPSDGYLNPPEFRVSYSVPLLEEMVRAVDRPGGRPWLDPDEWGPRDSSEYYTAQYCFLNYGRLLDLLDSARWLVTVESRRWLAQHPTGGFDDATWWAVWRGVLALRWSLNERRGPLPGYLPSRELAVRESGTVAPTLVIFGSGRVARMMAVKAMLAGFDVECAGSWADPPVTLELFESEGE